MNKRLTCTNLNITDGVKSWARFYVLRDNFDQPAHTGSFGGDLLLSKARIGEWECAQILSRMNKCLNKCPNCGEPDADLEHDLIFCDEFATARRNFHAEVATSWGKIRYENWLDKEQDMKVAELLGLIGKFTKDHASVLKRFLAHIYAHNRPLLLKAQDDFRLKPTNSN